MSGLLLALAAQAAGVSYPPATGASVDVSNLATKAEVQSVASSACVPMPQLPPMEVVGGSPGSGNACRLANAVQPRISRTVSGTTGSAGLAAVSWPEMPSVPKLTLQPYVGTTGATQAPLCFPVAGTVTTTGAQIKCFTTQSVTVSLLGAVVAPLTTAAAGVTFDVLALPAS